MDIRKIKFTDLSLDKQQKLQDLSESLKELACDKEGWCYKYYDQSYLGQAIYEDFVKYNESDKDYKFKFSDDLFESGILAQLEGFQFVAMLMEDFGLTDKKYDKELIKILDDILDSVEKDGEIHFDATPYLKDSDQFKDNNCYIDSMTWFMSAACSVFRLLIKRDSFEIGAEREERLISAFQKCMEYVTDSFIDVEDKTKFSYGWNFTGGCDKESPSLYFTMAVSEVLIDIFTTFEATIRQYETVEVQNEIERVLSGEASPEEIESKKTQIKLINDESKAGMPEDQLAREKSLFLRINKNLDAFAEGSLYNKLEKECKLAANDIWNLTKTKLVDEFFAPNLSTVSSETIEQSITSDALFNNIFIINILINAGVDEDLEDIINYYSVNGSKKYDNAIDDYDEIRNIMRLGYDKVYQMYTNMKKKNIDYKVNEYTLSFTETFSNDLLPRVQELRRARIRVFSLLPLLVKTKTSMSDFVIRYPQFDMQIYLEMILDNRMHDKNGNTLWIWEDSGYSTSSNFYFLSALNDFYGYYNKYELEYSKNAYKNREAKQKIEIECIEKSKASGEIFDLNQKLKDAFEQIEKVKEENEKLLEEVNKLKNDPLRKTLTDFIYNAIKDEIENIISNLFNDVAANITKDAMSKSTSKKDGTPVEVEDNPFEKSVQSLFTAMIKESMIDTIYQIDPSAGAENIDRKVRNMERRTSKDVKNLLLYYLAQVYRGGDGDDGGSDFVSTKGYEGIKDVLQEQDAKKEALKNKKD